jgi:hypothetical protein
VKSLFFRLQGEQTNTRFFGLDRPPFSIAFPYEDGRAQAVRGEGGCLIDLKTIKGNQMRARLEDGLKLDLNWLIRSLLRPGAAWGSAILWSYLHSGEEVVSGWISADMTHPRYGWLRLELGSLDQRIQLKAIPRHFGGRQWYFLCPDTGRRVSVLWKPPGARSFASRHAWGRQVAYGSQFETPRDRALSAAHDIRYRLGGKDFIPICNGIPPKPKWMRWRTYERIVHRCEANEAVCHQHLSGCLARLGIKC